MHSLTGCSPFSTGEIIVSNAYLDAAEDTCESRWTIIILCRFLMPTKSMKTRSSSHVALRMYQSLILLPS